MRHLATHPSVVDVEKLRGLDLERRSGRSSWRLYWKDPQGGGICHAKRNAQVGQFALVTLAIFRTLGKCPLRCNGAMGLQHAWTFQ